MLNKENVSLIDADTFIYIATYNKKDTPKRSIQEMFNVCDTLLEGVLIKTNSKKYCGFLTEGKSFRQYIGKQKEYKGNRKDFIKPEYYNLVKSYLYDELKFVTVYNYEADDLCIMAHNSLKQEGYNPIICSCDKDLKQVEGEFYDYKKDLLFKLSKDEAALNLWCQVLTGDVSDNIPGIEKIGPIKAARALENTKVEDYPKKVLQCYTEAFGEYEGISKFTENYKLCKMLDKTLEGDYYIPVINEFKRKLDLEELLGF